MPRFLKKGHFYRRIKFDNEIYQYIRPHLPQQTLFKLGVDDIFLVLEEAIETSIEQQIVEYSVKIISKYGIGYGNFSNRYIQEL